VKDPLNFPKSHRLLKRKEFYRLFQGAKKIKGKTLFLLFNTNELGCARLGLVIPKKQIKLASHRNRIKRFARESFRQRQQQLGPIDIIVFAYQSADNLDNKGLQAELEQLWIQLITTLGNS